MHKILKYLKPSILPIILIILLLVGQAYTEITLPSYTADVVNVGVSQGGIKNSVPEVIRESEMNKVLLFVEEENKTKVTDSYTLLDKDKLSKSDYEKYVKEYKILKEEPIYKLKHINKEENEKLNEILKMPTFEVYSLQSDSEQSKAMLDKFKAGIEASFAQMNPGFKLPEDATFFSILEMVPEEQKQGIIDNIKENFKEIPDILLEGAGPIYIKGEYSKIGIDTDNYQLRYIIKAGISMLLFTLISIIAAIFITLFSSRVSARLSRDLREKVFSKVVSFSSKEVDEFGVSSLITRSTNDITQIQNLMNIAFRMLIYSPILAAFGFYKVYTTDSEMSWTVGISVLALLILIVTMFIFVLPKFGKLQKLVDKLNLVSREIITGIPVIRAFNSVKREEKRFDIANMDLTKVNLFVNRSMSIMFPSMMLILNLATVLIVYVGAHQVDSGNIQVGDIIAFMSYSIQILISFLMISMVSIMIPRASVSAKRIAEVLEYDVAIKDSVNPVKFDNSVKGVVEFKDVSYRYHGANEDVLSNINFIAERGKTTAIIGSTGSGKTTLINLLPRFFDVTKGEILIDGVNIKDVTQHDLREKVGFVPQKGILFSGDIESNLKFGNENATHEEIQKAARIAQAESFIEEKEEKYKTEVSQGGTNVSGGQRQRLSIARAIVKNPDIYVFDDSFSALDYKTDIALRTALKEVTEDKTVIIVAQRISTILHADQIIVLEQGKIVGKGTHKELLKSSDVYYEIASSQLSKEELDNE